MRRIAIEFEFVLPKPFIFKTGKNLLGFHLVCTLDCVT